MGDVTTYTDATVVNGQTYKYSVCARSDLGLGPYTDSVEVTPVKSTSAPGHVSSLNAMASKGKVTLTWTPPDDDGGSVLIGYIILRGETADAVTDITQVGLVTSFLDEEVEIGKTYYYTIKAVNAVGQGDSVVPVQVKVQKEEADETSLVWVYILVAVVVAGALAAVFVYMRSRKED